MDKQQKVDAFLAGWIVTNVPARGYKPAGDLDEAKALADTCVRLASAQGITRSDMEQEVGDLAEHIRVAQNIAQAGADATGRDRHPSRASQS